MKKAVAIVFVIVAVLMSGMLVWGFIDAQKKESDVENIVQDVPTTTENSEEITQQEVKSINLSELSKHNKSNDCWVAIRGNVYDVSSYLDEHPGGADLILNYCGEDATSAYNNKGGEGRHSANADSILNTYLLGNLN
jgi:cytochrome b involved in lipid metabolism